MPGLVKIGRVEGASMDFVERRMAALHDTGVPAAFECRCADVFEDAVAAEGWVHGALMDKRYTLEREFFKLGEEEVMDVFRRLRESGYGWRCRLV